MQPPSPNHSNPHHHQQQQLIFSSDCVINLDDLGEWKDYTQDIEQMLANLQSINRKQLTIDKLNTELLKQILKADPQDTFHHPEFKKIIQELLDLLIDKAKQLQQSMASQQPSQISPPTQPTITTFQQLLDKDPTLNRLIFHNLMQIMEDSFTSYTFSEEGPNIIQWLIDCKVKNGNNKSSASKEPTSKSISKPEIQQFLYQMSKLCQKLCYVDNHELYTTVLLAMDQKILLAQPFHHPIQQIQQQQQWQEMIIGVYLHIIEHSLRNRHIRKHTQQKITSLSKTTTNNDNNSDSSYFFIRYKLARWNRNLQEEKHLIEKINSDPSLHNLKIVRQFLKANSLESGK